MLKGIKRIATVAALCTAFTTAHAAGEVVLKFAHEAPESAIKGKALITSQSWLRSTPTTVSLWRSTRGGN